MKRKSLLIMLLVALFVPSAMNAQNKTLKKSANGLPKLEVKVPAKAMPSNPMLSKLESAKEAALEELNGRGTRADNELLTEGFENMSSISTSYSATGWYAYNAGSGNNWTLNSSSNYANSGSKSAQVQYSSRYAANCYLVSAPFTVSSNMSELTVSLYERVRSASYAETFEVFFVKASDVSNLAGVASATKYNAIASASYTNTAFAQQSGTVTNSALAGQSVRVVVHCTSEADKFYLYIDDITVTETVEETCPKPTDLNATNLTLSSATVSWTGEADSYTLQYRVPRGFRYDFESAEPWTVDNFAPCTTYDGDGSTTGGIQDVTFTNQGYTGSFIAFQNGVTTNAVAHGGNAFGACFYATTPANNDWFILPDLAIEDGDVFTFWAKSFSSNYLESFSVGVYSGNGTFTTVLGSNTSVSNAWTEYSYNLSTYAGQTIQLAINCNSNDKFAFFIDDIFVGNPNNDTWDEVITNVTSPYTITGLNPETTYEWQVQGDCGTDGTSLWASSTFTTGSACDAPTDLTVSNITNSSATINWAGNNDTYNIQYGIVDPNAPVTVILTADDVWGDDSGYQMLLDADATAYGTTIPETGALTTSGDASAAVYAEFEYKIPANADGSLTTTNIVSNGASVSIEIPAGTYDWCITNPTPEDRMWIASAQGNVGGRQDDYVFEPGKTYEFHVYLSGENDATDVTITNNAEMTVVNNVTNPYTLTNLTANTTYVVQAQGVNCDGNGSTTEWSAGVSFTTLDGILVESITADDVEVVVGATANITNLVVLPADATNPAVTYTSNDEAIATVDANGVVTGVAVGETTITIAATDGSGVSTTINVTVTGIDVTGITAEDVEVVTGETATISYTVAPENATDASVTFTSADPTIATVDENGVVTGVSVGETTITIASVSNPEVTAEITVTVTSNPNAVQFTVNVPATAQPGDVITVEAYMAAPTSGNYDGFTSLGVHLYYDNTAFQHTADPTYGAVGNACMLKQFSYPSDGVVRVAFVQPAGSPTTVTGLLFSMEFTVLAEAELGNSYTFYVEPMDAANFTCNYNNGQPATQIPYEFTPSTVTISAYTLHITGYTNNGGYYLIASPIGTVNPTEVTNMITPNDDSNNRTYDLYRFQQDPEDNLEWRNYRQGVFDLEVGKGYLYAHRTDVDLVFTGSAISESTYEVPLTKVAASAGLEFPDWNLVGNPFAEIAHIAEGHPFYTLDVSGAYTLVSDGSQTIESMQGVFVVAGENEDHITFVKGVPSAKSPKVTLNVGKGTEPGVIDRAIVCFGETRQMPKFQFDRNSTKVYIPMEGKDYALVRGEEMGELPVNFKAESNGTYNLNFSSEIVEFAYLHLIDNMTGNDVDLLKTPSYSFEAKTTDYESRFKLVFATGDNSNDDNFAFYSNGSFVINNEGEAELQVIDVMGRILSSETINGCTNVNVNGAAGVYMLRLINGDNVKVQKVVVK